VHNVGRRNKRPPGTKVLLQADMVEARAEKPSNSDDPAWLKVRAEGMRRWAARRQAAHVRKIETRRKAPRKKKSTQS
jgi:hypothetical protein